MTRKPFLLTIGIACAIAGCGGSGGGDNGGGNGGGGNGGGGGGSTSAYSFKDTNFSTLWDVATVITDTDAKAGDNRFASGGNPGAYLQVFVTQSGKKTEAVFFRKDWTYLASKSGAIDTIDVSDDRINLNSTGQGQDAAYAIIQNNRYYITPITTIQSTGFTRFSSAALRASDFSEIDADLNVDKTKHPDFTTVGATITLGFVRGLSASQAKVTSGVDNIDIEIHPVAKPTAAR